LVAASGAPVHFSWFFRMDPEIEEAYGDADWVVRQCPGLIDEVRLQGDELGLHIHTTRRDSGRGGWIVDCEDQAWVEHCFRRAFEAYERSLGRSCRSVRSGDRWLNQATVDLVEALGAHFELSV